jgi:hypothetical protein
VKKTTYEMTFAAKQKNDYFVLLRDIGSGTQINFRTESGFRAARFQILPVTAFLRGLLRVILRRGRS